MAYLLWKIDLVRKVVGKRHDGESNEEIRQEKEWELNLRIKWDTSDSCVKINKAQI